MESRNIQNTMATETPISAIIATQSKKVLEKMVRQIMLVLVALTTSIAVEVEAELQQQIILKVIYVEGLVTRFTKGAFVLTFSSLG